MNVLKNRAVQLAYRGFFASIFILSALHVQTVQAAGVPLGVTQIEAVQTSAISDGTFADGWKWIFNVTVPTAQTLLQMKFGDWTNGSNIIPAIGNIRFYSAQATDANSENTALAINASNAYSSSTIMHLDPTQDLDSLNAGRQIQITMETVIPTGSASGSYSNSYGINTQVDSSIPVTPVTSGELTLTTGSDNPQSTTLMANQNSSTQNIVLNTFTLQNIGSGNVALNTLPVNVSVGGTVGGQTSNLVQTFKLYSGSTLLDTESASSTFGLAGVITFKNLNFTIPSGTTDSFHVVADIQPVGGTNPAQSGANVTVTVPSTSETDANGNTTVLSGNSTGYPIAFAVNGLTVASAPTSATATAALTSNAAGSQQTGTFTFVFNVTSFGQTIYVASTSNAYSLTINDQTAGTATSTTNITSGLTSTANRSAQGNFQVNSGQTAAFTLTATLSHGGSSHYFYAVLNSLNYGTSDATPSGSTVTLPSNYTTNAVSISS